MKNNFKRFQSLNESKRKQKGLLVLEDGAVFEGDSFGYERSVSGEVVFNTAMAGYPESMTDPSYRGQILTLTYPLTGKYETWSDNAINYTQYPVFESYRIQIQGLIVSQYKHHYSLWLDNSSVSDWLKEHKVPALMGIDTQMLTKRLREKGTMAGKIVFQGEDADFKAPESDHLVSQVSVDRPLLYKKGKVKVVVIDCGCKNSIIYSLLSRNITVLRVPFDYNFLNEDFDGILISNGPGNPQVQIFQKTIEFLKEAMTRKRPVFGVCLGHQLLARAAGAETYKLKYGHRSQNEHCIEPGTRHRYITTQNHGYEVRSETLPYDWKTWFINADDNTNEGLQCTSGPFMSVQFHPEIESGDGEKEYIFDKFHNLLGVRS